MLRRFDHLEQDAATFVQSVDAQEERHNIGDVEILCQSTDAHKDAQNEKCGEELNDVDDYLIHGIFPFCPLVEHINDFLYESIVRHKLVASHNAETNGGVILHVGSIAN